MKTSILSLLILASPLLLSAQAPTLTHNEFYYEGDIVQMVNCDPTGINIGAPGAGMTWDFSDVSASGGVSTTSILHDTSTVFLTSNVMLVLPDGRLEYMAQNSTDSYVDGITSPATGVTVFYNNYDIAKRPVTYNTTYVDSYRVDVATPFTSGVGHLTQTGDAYGTLKLPNGTFNNVLRVRKYQTETDTVAGAGITTITTSYLWFDTLHNAPLFRVDSVLSPTGSSQKAGYLMMPTKISELNSAQNGAYGGYLENNELTLTGPFEHDRSYHVVIYSVIGTELFTDDFTANGNSMRFDVGKSIPPGIYIVTLTAQQDPSSKEVIKVLKQS